MIAFEINHLTDTARGVAVTGSAVLLLLMHVAQETGTSASGRACRQWVSYSASSPAVGGVSLPPDHWGDVWSFAVLQWVETEQNSSC